jgi:putative transcriptional regulator
MSKMGRELIEAMQELLDYSEGKIDLRTSRYCITPVCNKIGADEIKETRRKLSMSQGVFAVVLGVSKKTVESWESGRYSPDGAARRLISIMQTDPAFPEKYGIVRTTIQSAEKHNDHIQA